MEDLIYKGSVLQIKKCAFDFLSLEEDLIDDDDDSWELMGRDLWLKSTFLYGDLNHVISNSRDEHKKTLTNLGNKLFHFMEEVDGSHSLQGEPKMSKWRSLLQPKPKEVADNNVGGDHPADLMSFILSVR